MTDQDTQHDPTPDEPEPVYTLTELGRLAARVAELEEKLEACNAREDELLAAYEMPAVGTAAIFRRRAWEAILESARARRKSKASNP